MPFTVWIYTVKSWCNQWIKGIYTWSFFTALWEYRENPEINGLWDEGNDNVFDPTRSINDLTAVYPWLEVELAIGRQVWNFILSPYVFYFCPEAHVFFIFVRKPMCLFANNNVRETNPFLHWFHNDVNQPLFNERIVY